MNNTDFESVVKKQMRRCNDVLTRKAKHYVIGSEDRLDQFKKMARLQNVTQLQALGGAAAKHLNKFFSMISQPNGFSMSDWNETITDSINYLILAKAILAEEDDE